jgi:hypothetical protein
VRDTAIVVSVTADDDDDDDDDDVAIDSLLVGGKLEAQRIA